MARFLQLLQALPPDAIWVYSRAKDSDCRMSKGICGRIERKAREAPKIGTCG
uniref:Uncharacterized protein n=1 Tax=Setaria digitata TaxID=48799 RepID=A0A915PXF1_9BILA